MNNGSDAPRPCNCPDAKSIILCDLRRGEGQCMNGADHPPTTPPAPAPPALNSDALITNLSAVLGGTTNQTNEL